MGWFFFAACLGGLLAFLAFLEVLAVFLATMKAEVDR